MNMSPTFSRSLLLLLLAFLLGCTGSPRVTKPTAAQIAEFTANARITLPPSAEAIGWREERGMDDALWLQVKMPAEELSAFLERSPFESAKWHSGDKYSLSQFDQFWTTPPVRYRSAHESLPNARVLNILIDESDDEEVVVYLMWHET
jgi:hypothetical protein